MRILKLLSVVLLLGGSALAQSRPYGVGSTPSEQEIRAMDISISPTGKELPPGRGTAAEGAQLYVQKACAACHGATLKDGRAPKLIRDEPKPGVDPHASVPAQPHGWLLDVRTNVASCSECHRGRAPARYSAIVGITHSSIFTCTRFASGCAPKQVAASAPRNARRRSVRLAAI